MDQHLLALQSLERSGYCDGVALLGGAEGNWNVDELDALGGQELGLVFHCVRCAAWGEVDNSLEAHLSKRGKRLR